jgi:hypothetical protein
MRAVARNAMHFDPAPGSRQPFLNEHGVVVSGIVEKDVNEPLGRICRRVALRISRTAFSALSGTRLLDCLIVAPSQGYDEPEILSLRNQTILSDRC